MIDVTVYEFRCMMFSEHIIKLTYGGQFDMGDCAILYLRSL